MSEYQYYEFHAVDRMLSAEEMRELRSCSSRARITRTSFVNHYDWGGFRGNEDRWMERSFDAFLYLANFGTRVLMLRLPANLLDLAVTRDYCAGYSFTVRSKNDKVVLTFSSDSEPDEEWNDGSGILSSILPVRMALAAGDRRALYLGWLLAVDAGTLKDKTLEPPVPPGLRQLSPCLEAFVEFLRLDRNLLEVAADASASIASPPDRQDLAGQVARMPAAEKDARLLRLMTEDSLAVSTALLRGFDKNRGTRRDRAATPKRRTVGELRRAANDEALERNRIARQRAAAEKARRQRETSRAREAYLASLAGKETRLWTKVGKLVATTQQGNYDAAVVMLIDRNRPANLSITHKYSPRHFQPVA